MLMFDKPFLLLSEPLSAEIAVAGFGACGGAIVALWRWGTAANKALAESGIANAERMANSMHASAQALEHNNALLRELMDELKELRRRGA